MADKIVQKFVRFLLSYYGVVMVMAILLAGISMPRVVHLFKTLSTDPIDLLPEKFPTVQTLRQIREKIEPKRKLGIVVESEHPENTRRLLPDLKMALEQAESVGRVDITKPGYDFFEKIALLSLSLRELEDLRVRIDRKIQRHKLQGLYISFEEEAESFDLEEEASQHQDRYGPTMKNRHYVSPDGKTYALYVQSRHPNLSMAAEARFQEEVKRVVEEMDWEGKDPTTRVLFSGSPRVLEYRSLIADLKWAGVISGILIFLPLLLRFRRPLYPILIFIPLVLGIPMGLAAASWVVPRLNVTTSFLFAILGGLGVETGIHLFSRYHEMRREGLSLEDTVRGLFLKLGPSAGTAVAALTITFFLMTINDFRGFSEFGLISGIGLWVVFLLYFTFFPALLIFGEKTGLLKVGPQLQELKPAGFIRPGLGRLLLIFFFGLTFASLLATRHIPFEYNAKKIRSENRETLQAQRKLRHATGGRVNSPAALIVQNAEEAQILKEAYENRKEEKPQSPLQGTGSLYDLVPPDQPEKLKVIDQIKALLADDLVQRISGERRKDLDRFQELLDKAAPVSFEDIPPEVSEYYLGKASTSGTLFLVFAKPDLELEDGKNAMAFAAELEEVRATQGMKMASSDAIVYADVLRTMFRDSKKALVLAFLGVFFIVFLDFKSFKKSLLILFSIAAGVLWVLGVMDWAGLKMNLYNMVMLPALMGMSIDNSIHLYHRYLELGKGSLPLVMSTTGVSAMLASLTNAAGFMGLIFCSHGGLKSMGVVAVIGLGTCLVTTLVFFPLILQFSEKRYSKTTVLLP